MIKIGSKDLEDFIWMSYRYCIGRKTIAASSHADTIANIMFKNPDFLSDGRKEFMAQDIRRCIFDTLRWNKRIRFENNYYEYSWDFYALLLESMSKCPYPNEVRYIIDMEKRTLSCEKYKFRHNETEILDKPDDMYYDLIGWVKLANALDESCHKNVIINLNGEEKTIRCFPYTAKTQDGYENIWTSLEKDANYNITQQDYIIPELIIKIEDI